MSTITNNRHVLWLLISLAMCLAMSLGNNAGAATITVDINSDGPVAIDGNCTLREAVTAANTNSQTDNCVAGDPGLDTITFNPGLEDITLLVGQLNITEPLTISAPPSGQTITRMNISRLLAVINDSSPLALENLTLLFGTTNADGAMPPTCLEDSGQGGAICSLSDLTINRCRISNNFINGSGAEGGGLYVHGSTLTVTDSLISNNRTLGPSAAGGGIRIEDGQVILANTALSGNRTFGVNSSGGGLSLLNSDASLTSSTVSDNETLADNAPGGGVHIFSSNITATNSTISGNETRGIDADGGGFYLFQGNITLNNSTVTLNSPGSGAGGVHIDPDISGSFDLTLNSTIIAGNPGNTGNVHFVNDSPLSTVTVNATASLFGDDASEVSGTNVDNVFTDIPELQRLGDNGCSVPAGAPGSAACVRTHKPIRLSPAIDAGENPLALADDQRGEGFPRDIGGQPDIGAFEKEEVFSDSFE